MTKCNECGQEIKGEPIRKHWEDDKEGEDEYYCEECASNLGLWSKKQDKWCATK